MHIQRNYTLHQSISTNPYFIYGPFSGLLVSSAAHTFIPAMFSNFSLDHPSGYLDKKTLMAFFAVYENPTTGDLTHRRGNERIPDNWYRRPNGLAAEYGTLAFSKDLVALATKNPSVLKIGGNTGSVNSFVGVDIGNLTGGVYNVGNLLNPGTLLCFLFQMITVAMPDLLEGGLLGGLLGIPLKLIASLLGPLFDNKCPGIQKWDGELFKRFPGSGGKLII